MPHMKHQQYPHHSHQSIRLYGSHIKIPPSNLCTTTTLPRTTKFQFCKDECSQPWQRVGAYTQSLVVCGTSLPAAAWSPAVRVLCRAPRCGASS
eukprot:1742068-Amphidinium_carterae.1